MRSWIGAGLFLLLLLPLPVAAYAPATTVITNDGGGLIIDYDIKYHHPGSWIIDGLCASACTLVLSTGHVCATPRAVLAFHAAFIGPSRQISPEGTAFMMSHYPPALRVYLAKVGALNRILPLTVLRAPAIWRYIPRC